VIINVEIAIRISKNAAAMSGTTAQLKYTKWIKL
jgi:hypothetical protein